MSTTIDQAKSALRSRDVDAFEAALRQYPEMMHPSSDRHCIFRYLIWLAHHLPTIFLERFFDIATEHGISTHDIVHQTYEDSEGATILGIICWNGYKGWVAPVVNRCPDVLLHCDNMGRFPLYLAVLRDELATFCEMARHAERLHPSVGASMCRDTPVLDPNIEVPNLDTFERTIVHRMARIIYGLRLYLRSYLHLGFLMGISTTDLLEITCHDQTPMQLAIFKNNKELVKLLMALGVESDSSNAMVEDEVAEFRYEIYFDRSLLSWLTACI